MTQEEKEKVYIELINRLEDVKEAIKKQNYGIAMDVLCKPYPEFQVTTHSELKDSENENIRKLLIEAVIQVLQDQYCSNRGVSKEKVVAWLEKQGNLMKALQISNAKIGELIEKNYYLKEQLEKQGEQKTTIEMKTPKESLGIDSDTYNKIVDECIYGEQKAADEADSNLLTVERAKEMSPFIVEPKFKHNDFIINNEGNIYKVVGVCDVIEDEYRLRRLYDNGLLRASVDIVDNKGRLWDITKDAKDGDVLVSESNCGLGTWYCIFKSLNDHEGMTVHCYLTRDGRFETKKELCFDKDPYNTKPATKEQRDLLFQKMHEAGYKWDAEKKELKNVEQKPAAWSEEDEKQARQIERIVHDDGCTQKLQKQIADWFKSLKDRYTWKPTMEQLTVLSNAIELRPLYESDGTILMSLYYDLKKLK